MNIKPQLDAEARKIVETHRSSGGELHDLIAKCASDRHYNDNAVRELSRLVNRHAFKQARIQDGTDEFGGIVNAESVLFRMRSPGSPSVKAASYNPGILSTSARVSDVGFNGRPVSVDYGPTFVAKLASRDNELKSEIRYASAKVREGLTKIAKLAESIKRVGLEKTAGYQGVLSELDADARSIIEVVLESSPATKVAFTTPQLRMHIPAALENTKAMAKLASEVHEVSMRLADLQERRERVASQAEAFRKGHVV